MLFKNKTHFNKMVTIPKKLQPPKRATVLRPISQTTTTKKTDLEYEKKLKEYNKKVAEYESAIKEAGEWDLAFKFYQRGIAPTQVKSGAPTVASKLALIYKEESQARQAQFRAELKAREQIIEPEQPKEVDRSAFLGIPTATAEEVLRDSERRKQQQSTIFTPQYERTDYSRGTMTMKPPTVKEAEQVYKRPEVPYKEIESRLYPYGTISTSPSPTLVSKSIGEPAPFRDFISEAIRLPVEFAEKKTITEPKQRYEERQESTIFTPNYKQTEYSRGTMVMDQPRLTALGTYQKEQKIDESIEQEILRVKVSEKINKISQKYQDNYKIEANKLIEKGTTQEELDQLALVYQQKAEEEAQTEVTRSIKDYEKKAEEREKKRIKELTKREFKEGFVGRRAGDIMRAGAYAIPIYGTSLLAADIYSTAKDSPSIAKFAMENPREFVTESAASLITFGLVGGGVSGIKRAVRKPKIEMAINEAERVIKTKGMVKEKDFARLSISKEAKAEIEQLHSQGYSIRKADITLRPKKGLEKYTPKVKGEIVEVVNREGKVVERISSGKIKAELKGQKISQDLFAKSVMKLEEGGSIRGYTEVVQSQKKRPVIGIEGERRFPKEKQTLTRLYEESRITGFAKKDKVKKVDVETEVKLLGTEKYTGEPLLTKYEKLSSEEYSKLGKPYAKTEATEFLTPVKSRLDLLTQTGKEGLIRKKTKYYSEGIGKTRILLEEQKPLKIKISEEPSIAKPIQYKKPKGEFKPTKELDSISPSYVGGEGGQLAESLFYGQQTKVKGFAEETPIGSFSGVLGESFITGLSKDFTRTGFVKETGFSFTKGLTGLGSGQQIKQSESVSVFGITKLKSRQLEKETQKPQTSLVTVSGLAQSPKTETALMSGQLQAQKFETSPKLKTATRPSISPSITTPLFDFKFPEEIRYNVDFPEDKKKKTKEQGYYAEVYRDATKKQKARWERLNKKPMTKLSALSLAAREVDDSISARGKIVKFKSPKIKSSKKTKPKSEVIDTGDRYYLNNQNKFRKFQQKKGKRTKLPNQIIELQKYRLDSPREKIGLSSGRRTPFGF